VCYPVCLPISFRGPDANLCAFVNSHNVFPLQPSNTQSVGRNTVEEWLGKFYRDTAVGLLLPIAISVGFRRIPSRHQAASTRPRTFLRTTSPYFSKERVFDSVSTSAHRNEHIAAKMM